MNEVDLEALLREAHQSELARVPKQYNRKEDTYGKCPLLWRYRQAAAGNTWEPGERIHVRHCPYCQKTIAMQWSFTCPTLEALNAPGFEEAKRLHVEEDGCVSCRRAADSQVPEPRPWKPLGFALVGLHSSTMARPWIFRQPFGDPQFELTLWLEDGTLKMRVQTGNNKLAGRAILVQIRTQTGALVERRITLLDAKDLGALEELEIRDFVPADLEDSQVQAYWI